MPVNPDKSKKTSIVVPIEIYNEIEKLSVEESRTVSQMMVVLMKEALEKRRQKPEKS
ncbi:MAG: hypothetical protein KME64_01165 [Scytonematopsis contorta HA4267-MV1]|jgi:predicted DNA-binding protein|nr:hypothetical protein [Scytonematopsis contorta HA4267-MV1]